MASIDVLPDARPWNLPDDTMLPECPFNRDGAHDFDARLVEDAIHGSFLQQNCRRCGLVLPLPVPTPNEPREQECPRCFGEIYVWPDGFISKTDGNGSR